MHIFNFLKPKPTITDHDIATGLRWFTWEGASSLGLFSITTSGFLAAYALALGADNFQIGAFAAICIHYAVSVATSAATRNEACRTRCEAYSIPQACRLSPE